jgi:ABC-2 type transport system permease protein
VDILPPALQVVARLNPVTYVFEGMRSVLLSGTVAPDLLLLALGLTTACFAVSVWLFAFYFDQARENGMLARLD